MLTINLAPLMAEVFMPILLMVIAPTVILRACLKILIKDDIKGEKKVFQKEEK